MIEMSEAKVTILKPGTVLENKWIVIELIGKGAMGEVYRAHQQNLKRDVAVKVISEDVLSELGEDEDELGITFGRFQREVETMAKVRHPNILNIFDYGELTDDSGKELKKTAFIIMEYIPGNSLRFTLSDDGLDDLPEEYAQWLMRYFIPILDGVELLHNNSIIHRDIKPENIFMDGEIPKIADFGLARSRHMKAVTTSIEMLGTLAYMAPEQGADFKNAEITADIYSLGKILYEAVAGKITEKVLPFTSVALENPQNDFLAEINEVIKRATAEQPADRYQSVSEMRAGIQHALSVQNTANNHPRRAAKRNTSFPMFGGVKQTWLVVGGALVLFSMISLGLFYLSDNPPPLKSLDVNSYLDHDSLAEGKQVVALNGNKALQTNITGWDGSRMILTGRFGTDTGVKPFYVDEQKVTNFMFVEFLNSIDEELSVYDGVVRKGNTIISYIGNGPESTEAIIYEHDTFHLKEQASGDQPVVRITFHGAHLYAAHYGKELLSARDWIFAYRFHLEDSISFSPGTNEAEENLTGMMHKTTIDGSKNRENETLGDMGKALQEWVNLSPDAGQDEASKVADSFVAGVIDERDLVRGDSPAKRAPWEGFEDVGFRTKVRITKK